MSCAYCYYSHVSGRPLSIRVPERHIIEKILADYLTTCGPIASIAWQGGEPLLAGLPFFRKAVELETRFGRRGQIISNSLQTNGVLATEEWGEFFHQYRFLIGVSVDGPEHIHDLIRLDAAGRGTYNRVMRGLNCLRKQQVDVNVLTVVGPHNVRSGRELMKFYKEEGLRWIQFIPQMNFSAQDTQTPGTFAITPQEYGNFLCETFDEWYSSGTPELSIRYFDNVMQSYVSETPQICTMQQKCPRHLVLESNGDVFPCDFYLDSDWKLGNVQSMGLVNAFDSSTYHRFAALKPDLPKECRLCPWLQHCRGGCPRNRGSEEMETAPDYFCESFKQFFTYADGRLRQLAQRIEEQRRANVRGSAPIKMSETWH